MTKSILPSARWPGCQAATDSDSRFWNWLSVPAGPSLCYVQLTQGRKTEALHQVLNLITGGESGDGRPKIGIRDSNNLHARSSLRASAPGGSPVRYAGCTRSL